MNGKEVITLGNTSANNFREGVAVVFNAGKYGFIDKTGKALTPIKYEGYNGDLTWFYDGMAKVESSRKYGFVDKTGKEVIPLIHSNAVNYSEGLGAVYTCTGSYPNEVCKWNIIDKTGKTIFSTNYGLDDLFGFSDGLIAVYQCQGEYPDQKCKYGFMDKTGKLVIPLKYDYAEAFAGGVADVELNGEKFKVDKKGVEIKGGKSWMDEDY